MSPRTATLNFTCPDQIGLVSRISGFIHNHNGNILSLNEYVDTAQGRFFLRLAFDMKDFLLKEPELNHQLEKLAEELGAYWKVYYSDLPLKTALFVSKYDHCLRDLLWRQSMGEFQMEIPLIVSNHSDLEPVAKRYGIPYHVFRITRDNKAEMEEKELLLLEEYEIDTIVLARYMQILSPDFVKSYPNRIITIHHSFLPAFIGSNPYRQAFERGVKIIGATSHYVTEDLDEGPIIDQGISRITHRDGVPDLITKGRDLERIVLARAMKLHSEHRVLVHGRKTVVFE